MAGIGGLSGSTTNSLYSTASSLPGFGGLASGLDRDSLIENMTFGTQSKIQAQKQKKQILLWQQEAMRNITDKLYNFQQKFMSFTSPTTNLLSSGFFAQNQVTSIGENSKYVSVTGNSPMLSDMSVVGVKQLATTEQLTSASGVSGSQEIVGKNAFSIEGTIDTSNIAGHTLKIEFGHTTYSFKIPSEDKTGKEYDFSKEDDIKKAINAALENVDIDGGTLADKVEAELNEDGKVTLTGKNDEAGNGVSLKGGTALKGLGFSEDQIKEAEKDGIKLTVSGTGVTVVADGEVDLYTQTSRAELLQGKKITFTYNGTTKTITLAKDMTGWDENNLNKEFIKHLNDELGNAFGEGKIDVKLTDDGKLSFKTNDSSSTFSINSADQGILGTDGVFGIKAGASNRFDFNKTLSDYLGSNLPGGVTEETKLSFTVNGKTIDGLTYGSSIGDIMNKINGANAGVKISYQSVTDKFVLTATESGSGHTIKFGNGEDLKDKEGNVITDDAGIPIKNNVGAEILSIFSGKGVSSFQADENGTIALKGDNATLFNHKAGQDAIVAIKYSDSDEAVEVVRGSNSFELDGLNFSVSGTFGYKDEKDKDGNVIKDDQGNVNKVIDPDADVVTFDSKIDSEKIYTAVKDMVDAYNEIIDLVNKTVNTKQNPNDKYAPLTDQQKADMSEDEINKWNEKAQVGVLFGNSDLRGLADAMRFILPSGSDWTKLQEFGLTTSNNYNDHGKLSLDETKFKAALQTDSALIQEIFTRKEETEVDASGKKVVTKEAGIMQKMNMIYEKYAGMTGSTKGILVERAGSTHAPTTILKNGFQTQMDDIQKTLDSLLNRLKSEQDRYIKQFSSLENVIAQMNAQSSYLSQLSGGYY